MLVLSRKTRESFTVTGPDGSRIHIEIVEIQDGKVRVGFTAPNTYTIFRKEIQDEIDAREKGATP